MNKERLTHVHSQSDPHADYSTENQPARIHIKQEYDDSCLILDHIKKTIGEINSCERGLSEFCQFRDMKAAHLCKIETDLEMWSISRKRVQSNIDQLKKQHDLVVIDEEQKQKEYVSIITNYEKMILTQEEIILSRPLMKKRNALWNQLEGYKIQLALLETRIADLNKQKNQLKEIQQSRLINAVINFVDPFLKKKAEYQMKFSLLDQLNKKKLEFEKFVELQQKRKIHAGKREILPNQMFSKNAMKTSGVIQLSRMVSSRKSPYVSPMATFKNSASSASKSPKPFSLKNSSTKVISFTTNSPRVSPQFSSSPIGRSTTKNMNQVKIKGDKFCGIPNNSVKMNLDPKPILFRKDAAQSKSNVHNINVHSRNNSCRSNDVCNGFDIMQVSHPGRTTCTTPVHKEKNADFQNENCASPRSRIPVLKSPRLAELSRIPIRFSPVSKTMESPKISFSPDSKKINSRKLLCQNEAKQEISVDRQTPKSEISSYNSPKKSKFIKSSSATTPRLNSPFMNVKKMEMNKNSNFHKVAIINTKKKITERENKSDNTGVTCSPSPYNLKTSKEMKKKFSCQAIGVEKKLLNKNKEERKMKNAIINLESPLKNEEKLENRLSKHTRNLEADLSDELESECAIFFEKQALTLKDLLEPVTEVRLPLTENVYEKPCSSGSNN